MPRSESTAWCNTPSPGADHVTRTCADHELLARAVLAGNADAAEAAMREHIRHSMADVLAQFDRA